MQNRRTENTSSQQKRESLGKSDEDFTFKTLLYGIEKPEPFFRTKLLPDYSQMQNGKTTIQLTRNMFKVDNLEQCLTKIKVITKNGTFETTNKIFNVYVNTCEDEIVTIEYLHNSYVFSTKTLTIEKNKDL